MVSNIGKITNLAGTPSTGLVDGSDKLHSGILKVLESFSQGDMCISHAGFTITGAGSHTQYNLAQPIKFLKRGELVTHTVTLVEPYTGTTQDTDHTRYDWVLINPATPELVIVQGTAASTPTVADITAGFIPIALVEITAGTDNDKFDYSFQTFTLNVTKKSLSIMHGGVEAGNITGDTDSIDIASTITNADINLTPNGQGDVKLGTLKVDGDQTVGAGQDGHVLTYTHSNGKAALAASSGIITALNNQTTNRLVTIGATTTELDGEANLTFDGTDLKLLKDANDADVSLTLGTSDAESLKIQVLNGGSNKTAEEVHFSTATASGSADAGKMIFDIDGTDKLLIDDAGIDVTGAMTASTTIQATTSVTSAAIVGTTSVTGGTTTGTTFVKTNGQLFQKPEHVDNNAPSAPIMSGAFSVVYVSDISGSPANNNIELPDPNTVGQAVYTIRNIGANPITITIQGGLPYDGNTTHHALVTVATRIDLPIGQHVTVQAIVDSGTAGLQTGYYIIGN